MVKPLVYLFQGEAAGGRWRKLLNGYAGKKDLKMDVHTVIEKALEDFEKLNPVALKLKGGEKTSNFYE